MASTVADSVVSVSFSLSRMIFFTTSDLLAITVTHVQPSAHAGERAPLDDAVIKNGNGGWTNYSQLIHWKPLWDVEPVGLLMRIPIE